MPIKVGNFIRLTDKLAIRSDSMNWMLCKGKVIDGEDSWEAFQFQGTLEKIVKTAFEYMLRTGHAQNAEELLALSNKISALISQKFTASFEMQIKSVK